VPRNIADELRLRITGKSRVMIDVDAIEVDRSRAFIELEGRSEIVPAVISGVIDKETTYSAQLLIPTEQIGPTFLRAYVEKHLFTPLLISLL
jgi:hypothetical protein